MEENNNFMVKGLAIILIAILGLNVYRTETTKKELAGLDERVSQLTSRLDSRQIPESTPAVPAVSDDRRLPALERKVSGLEEKIKSLQNSVDRLAKAPSRTASSSASSPSTSSQTRTATPAAAPKAGRVSVTAKAKVENRYVRGTTYVPKITSGPAGVVIINVTMDQVGHVNRVSLNTSSTIKDEDIVDKCKESALRTEFSINFDAPVKTTGTITYTFRGQ